jgi:hypothetical protein
VELVASKDVFDATVKVGKEQFLDAKERVQDATTKLQNPKPECGQLSIAAAASSSSRPGRRTRRAPPAATPPPAPPDRAPAPARTRRRGERGGQKHMQMGMGSRERPEGLHAHDATQHPIGLPQARRAAALSGPWVDSKRSSCTRSRVVK